MPKDNLQTVIVSKSRTKSRSKAEKIARKHASRMYTSRETKSSFRFRQRPPKDFVEGSFRTFQVPDEEGVSLVYGDLKKNPSIAREARMEQDFIRRSLEAADGFELVALAKEVEATHFDFNSIKDRIKSYVVDAIYRINLYHPQLYCSRSGRRGLEHDLKCFQSLLRFSSDRQKRFFDNPGKHMKLKNPKRMPDPGACANLGNLLEFKFKNGNQEGIWDHEGQDYLFMWSPKYKAIVCVKEPSRKLYNGKVSRKGGAAKMYERFAARPASKTFEIEIPDCKLQKLGKAIHIVYRSDKWSDARKKTDYIHDFGKGVQLYCGPSLQDPEVFLCFGGKLTCTERGLVF